MSNNVPTSTLPAPIGAESHYLLRSVDGHLSIWIDYTDDDGEWSYLAREGISHAEDFSTHVDDLEEEMRYLRAEFI